ncbi:MAG TPA: hypothetical protein VNZ86_00095 [Bacteroidia bacterium]|jgi:hypothetical protein|nr:hypothetical protein [Bacteroidia bacterium]
MRFYSFFLSLLFLFFTGFISAQPLQTEAEKQLYVQNKIKTIEVSSLKLNRDIDKRTLLDERVKLDKDGNMLEQTYYDSTGLEMMKWTHVYKGGKLSERFFCIYRDTIAISTLHYSEKGFIQSEFTENTDGKPLCQFLYTCDAKGKITESSEEVFPEFQNYLKQAYKTDRQGFLILRFMDETKNHIRVHYKYEYSRKGLLEKVTEMKLDTVDFAWINIEYTREGFRKGFTVRHLNGKRYKCFYAYDNHGFLKEEAGFYFLNTVVLDQERNSYMADAKGKVKKRIKYRNNEMYMLYNYSYEYWE